WQRLAPLRVLPSVGVHRCASRPTTCDHSGPVRQSRAVTTGDASPMPDALPAAPRPVPIPSSALLARLAPLTPVPGRPDLVAHYAPDVFALWQAWEEECGARQEVPFWAA